MSDTTASARPAAGGTGASGAPAAPVVSRRAWQALIVLLAGMFIALLDTTIVNVALPTIRTSLEASESTLSWIISGYALAFGLALIPAGRLGDRYGHKWVFVTGIALFTLASLACGVAQDDLQLVIARVVQGLAGGLFVPAVTAFIQLLFPPQARGKAFAIMGAVIGVSSALGPIVGGLIIQAAGEESGWRLVFFVNLPVGLATVIAAIFLLPSRRVAEEVAGDVRAQSGQRGGAQQGGSAPAKAKAPAASGVDLVGILLVSAGLVALLVPLIDGQDQGWPLWTYLSLAGGVVLLALFGAWEVMQTRRSKGVLVPPHLFTHPAFTGGVILAMVYFAAFTSIFFTISILWQSGLGNSALESGLVSIPFAIGSIVGSSQSNRLTTRLGRTVLVIGTALVSVGLIWLWLVLLNTAAADLTSWMLLVPLLLAGIGNGLFIAPNAQFIVATVDPAEAGAASGVIGTVQRVGSAVGIAVIGSVLFAGVAGAGIRGPQMVPQAFTDASASAMGVSAIFAVVAFALVFALPRRVSRGH
ncbi:MFS family permease [Clavibacter michiganensis]|uniref:MFS transporter n=1 Tax=Clavibacter michiganensis TaxID=28447 RepID=UPI001AE90D23|nr:MFS transporter [Clavibacter michiganensis]MBP2457084.1 MFS family permease [Clavibacter michiganensis]MDQ0409654.1 MFS family permease [Clavibacter michiganensis]